MAAESPFDDHDESQFVEDCLTESALPPLRIGHLLLWTAVASVVFAVVFSYQRTSDQIDDPRSALTLMWYLPASAELSALLVVLLARRAGVRDWQPGHGLLLLSGLEVLAQLVLFAVFAAAGEASYWVHSVYQLFRFVLVLSVGATLAWRTPGRWRWVFVWAAAEPIARFFSRLLIYSFVGYQSGYHGMVAVVYCSMLLPQLVAAGLVTVGMLGDRREGKRRHWTHWIGVAGVYLFIVLMLVTLTAVMLGPAPTAGDP
ncbi:hypothetical protein Pla123a_38340 [Posidoniimonas polymericola]|uniref:Uncharacterized protein n=1 Tax=Posidoniimonas polymericola TaxID=2528002 RepID=A0A5C5YET2_9BACT|nr:hypothetical protein [Posidoniimonas polymericola]TWT73498.1 hypothetical protein Pla123a_38340 [Posidoniimonas polymericola]